MQRQLSAGLLLVALGAPAGAVEAPAPADFGASVAAMKASLGPLCDQLHVRELDPAELPIAQESHTQIDCHGFEHAGVERLAEFVFADDALAFVWVLTDASEEGDLLARLKATFGEPTHAVDAFVAFADDRAALRRDKPELLYYGEAVAPMYRGWFDSMAAGQ